MPDEQNIAETPAVSPVDQSIKLEETFYKESIKSMRRERLWTGLKRSVFGLVVTGVVSTALYSGYKAQKPDLDNVIPVVRIGGEIGPMIDLDRLTANLERAFSIPSKAVILSIDSPGGDPTLAQRIGARLKFLRSKNPEKKVVAVCERLCASAAYMVAIKADEVIAGPYSLVGSIGAIITSANYSKLMDRVGVTYSAYGSGPYKAMLSPYLPANKADDEKAYKIVKELGKNFANEVKTRRKISPGTNIETGEIWTAEQALQMGLIDRIAVIEDVAFVDYNGAIPVIIDSRPAIFSGIAKSFAELVVENAFSITVH